MPNKNVDLGALFIGRNGARLVLGQTKKRGVGVKPICQQHVDWEINELSMSAIKKLSKLISLLKKYKPQLDCLAVSCYGPFLSLKTGEIDGELSKGPLGGIKIREFLHEELEIDRKSPSPIISFCTDVSALALGESVVRNSPEDQITGFVVVTEGVGLGVVYGGDFFPSAHHPEIGILPLRIEARDPMRPNKVDMSHAMSLEDLASNSAMRKRGEKFFAARKKRKFTLEACRDGRFWDTRAYYIAQACLSIISVNPIHKIYLAADIDPLGDFPERVRSKFDLLVKERVRTKNPVPLHKEMLTEGFISKSISHPYPTDIGVVGLLNFAALTLRKEQ